MLAYSSALLIWAVLWLPALLLKAGLGPALRGAFVGADRWVLYADHAGNFFSQVTAVSTSTLLVVLGLSGLRSETKLLLRLSSALSAALPTAILFLAQRTTLPHLASAVAALLSGLVLLLGTNATHFPSKLRWSFLLSGGCVIARACAQFAWGMPMDGLVTAAASAFASICSISALVLGLWYLYDGALKTAVVLGLGLLLGIASGHAGTLHSTALFLVAQTIRGMADSAALGAATYVQFSIAALSAVAHFGTWRTDPRRFALSIVLLTIHTSLAPLPCSVIALAGIFLLVIYGADSPQASTTIHSHVAHRPQS